MLIARLLLIIFFLCIPRVLPLETGHLSYLNKNHSEPFSYVVSYSSHHDNKSLKKSFEFDSALLPKEYSLDLIDSIGALKTTYHEFFFTLDARSLKKARAPPLA